MDAFMKNPILYILLVLVLGSSGLDMSASNKQTEAIQSQVNEIQQLRFRVDTIADEIIDNSERISRNEVKIDDHHDTISDLQHQLSILGLRIDVLEDEEKNEQ